MASPIPHMNEECELFELDPPAMTIEKSFFTHYTICKYIDDLPEEWSVRDDKEDELNVRCSKVGANIELDSNGSCKRVLFARPLSTCQLKKNANQNLSDSESEKSKTDSSRKKSEKFKSNNFTKNCKEFLPQKNDNQKTKNTEADEMKKELSATAAGKSDSRIGSFNEQYNFEFWSRIRKVINPESWKKKTPRKFSPNFTLPKFSKNLNKF